MDYFTLTRAFWDFAFENPEKIKPNHCAMYLFIIEHCNRLAWKKKFGLPTTMVKDAIGIRSYNTYIDTLNDLVDFGLIEIIEKSKNQYSSNIIALSNFDKALNKALDKALIKHGTKQSESTVQSISSIDKQDTIYNKTNLQKTLMSEIKISDDKKFLIVNDKSFEVSESEILHFKIAESFRKLFIKNLLEKNAPTNHQKKATYQNYVSPIRLMLESNEATKQQIDDAYRFLNSPEGEFWKSNILSTKTLREKITQIIAKKNTKVIIPNKNQISTPDPNKRKEF